MDAIVERLDQYERSSAVGAARVRAAQRRAARPQRPDRRKFDLVGTKQHGCSKSLRLGKGETPTIWNMWSSAPLAALARQVQERKWHHGRGNCLARLFDLPLNAHGAANFGVLYREEAEGNRALQEW